MPPAEISTVRANAEKRIFLIIRCCLICWFAINCVEHRLKLSTYSLYQPKVYRMICVRPYVRSPYMELIYRTMDTTYVTVWYSFAASRFC